MSVTLFLSKFSKKNLLKFAVKALYRFLPETEYSHAYTYILQMQNHISKKYR